MAKNNLSGSLYFLAITAFIFLNLSWQSNEVTVQHQQRDTVPKNERNIVNVDEAIKALEKVEIELDVELKNLNEKLKKMEIERTIKEIDVEKIKADVAEAVKSIDAAKIKADVEASLAKIDTEKIKAEVEAEIKKINFDEMERELKKIKPQVEESLKKAKADIQKNKDELKEYKAFEKSLAKDGLINEEEGYTIVHKDGRLIINDKVQSAEVYNKHRSFLQKHKNFTLSKAKNDSNMNVD